MNHITGTSAVAVRLNATLAQCSWSRPFLIQIWYLCGLSLIMFVVQYLQSTNYLFCLKPRYLSQTFQSWLGLSGLTPVNGGGIPTPWLKPSLGRGSPGDMLTSCKHNTSCGYIDMVTAEHVWNLRPKQSYSLSCITVKNLSLLCAW